MSYAYGNITNIPSVYDYATGDGELWGNALGTPSLDGQVLSIDEENGTGLDNPFFEEYSDSPELEFAEQCTITHRFRCDLTTGISVQQQYCRGYLMSDSMGNVSRVLSTRLIPDAKSGRQSYTLTVVSEAQSFANPPDEFNIDTIQINPPLEKHPRYPALTYQDKKMIRDANVSDYVDVSAQCIAYLNTLSGSLTDNLIYPGARSNERAQAMELLLKKQKGEETFYLSGYKITYSQYFWGPQFLNPGGYMEDPFKVIPAYYWSTTNSDEEDNNNIFAYTTSHNMNIYPNTTLTGPPYGLSWLREEDKFSWVRTWFKKTCTWTGATLGTWDNELYSPTPQPLQVSRYMGNINSF